MRWLWLCLSLAGCTDDRKAIHGRFVDRLYSPSGVVESPADPSARAFRVYSNDRWYPESGLAEVALDGTLYIPDVPDGPYVLNAVYPGGAMSWYQREDHEFVDVAVKTGRMGAQTATHVPMELQIDNLTPWYSNDDLHVDCYENGTEHQLYELDTPPITGATQVQATFDWASTEAGPLDPYSTPYLLDANAGDMLTVSRMAQVPSTFPAAFRLTQIARGTANSQRDGEPSTFTGAFVDVPATITQQFTVDVPAIAAQLPDVNDWTVSLEKSPASIAFDRFGPSLLAVGDVANATAPMTFIGSYGDPFTADWQLVVSGAYQLWPEPLVFPRGRLVYAGARAYATEQRHLEPGATFTFAPTIDFIASASLDGHAVEGDLPWDGNAPLSFHVDLPSGVAGFTADILLVPDGEIYPKLWTTLRSQTADLTLPADALQVGLDYLVRVAVTNETETSRSTAYTLLGPFRLIRQ